MDKGVNLMIEGLVKAYLSGDEKELFMEVNDFKAEKEQFPDGLKECKTIVFKNLHLNIHEIAKLYLFLRGVGVDWLILHYRDNIENSVFIRYIICINHKPEINDCIVFNKILYKVYGDPNNVMLVQISDLNEMNEQNMDKYEEEVRNELNTIQKRIG